MSGFSLRTSTRLQNTINNLQSHFVFQKRGLARLSTGKRINGASDDGAGLSISSKLNSQLRSTSQAKRNINDATSLLQVAEGGLNEIHKLLFRLRELGIQAANGATMSSNERSYIEQEKTALLSQMSVVAKTTEFNRFYPLAAKSTGSGTGGVKTLLQEFGVSGTTLSRASGIVTFAKIPAGTTNLKIDLNNLSADDDIQLFTADGKHLVGTPVSDWVWTSGSNSITTTTELQNALFTTENGYSPGATYDATNLNAGGTNAGPAGATYSNNAADLFATTYNGMNIGFGGDSDQVLAPINDGVASSPDNREVFTIDSVNEDLLIHIVGSGSFSITAYWDSTPPDIGLAPPYIEYQVGIFGNSDNRIGVELVDVDADSMGLTEFSLATQSSAQSAIDVIDATIRVISDARAKFGATRNRLNNSLGYMDTLKQTTARTLSKIQDADMAFEMASLVRENILAKSGISMIAQIQDGDKLMSQLIANATGGR